MSYGYHHLVTEVANVVEHDPRSPVALHVNPPENFRPIAGKKNVLLTMWESRDFPADHLKFVRQADALIVPSQFCVRLFESLADCPVYLASLGVDLNAFAYRRRAKPKMTEEEPFVWFWCASSDPRKGWALVARAWQLAFAGEKETLLYMKTSGTDKARYEKTGNVIMDSRNLEPAQLAGLFAQADGFLYPSMGEGFGLTCAEAMACGCPVVGTSWSGHADFLHGATGWPIQHELQRKTALVDRHSMAEDGLFEIAVPDPVDMIRQMRAVMGNYRAAQKKAERAARLIRTRYSWPKFAATLLRILREVSV